MAIDIGSEAINRPAAGGWGNTILLLVNPANATGTITSVEVWAASKMTGARVGTFYLVSGTDYKCRDSATLGSVNAGSKRTFSGLSISVVTGDFIGIYFESGSIERTASTDNRGYISGEYIDPGDQATYTVGASSTYSLYGTGEEVGGVTHYGSATLSGIGTLAGIGRGIFIGKSTLLGTGTLVAIGRRIVAGVASLTGVGSLSALGGLLHTTSATLTGVGSLVASGTVVIIHYGTATLSGVGSLTAIGRGIYTAKATLVGVGTLSALGGKILTGVATLSGVGTLSAIGSRILTGAVTLSGAGSLSAIGQRIVAGSATLVGAGLLTAKGVGIFAGKATLSGVGTVSAIGMLIIGGVTHYASVVLSGVGSLVARAVITYDRILRIETTITAPPNLNITSTLKKCVIITSEIDTNLEITSKFRGG